MRACRIRYRYGQSDHGQTWIRKPKQTEKIGRNDEKKRNVYKCTSLKMSINANYGQIGSDKMHCGRFNHAKSTGCERRYWSQIVWQLLSSSEDALCKDKFLARTGDIKPNSATH